jgi:Electron transfer DM13
MLRSIIIFVAGGVLGTAVGLAAGLFVYPYLFLADIVLSEQVTGKDDRVLAATGSFVHVNPSDSIPYGQGEVTVYRDLVHLEDSFEVGPGPKFHVYLVPARDIMDAAMVSKSMFVDLGRLRAFKGSQNYAIPAGIDIEAFGSVVIWCEQFGVLISPATLEFATDDTK